MMKRTIDDCVKAFGAIPYCKCGCGLHVNINPRRYSAYKLNGYPKFINHHSVRTNHPMKGKHHKKESIDKISKNHKGNKGKTFSKEHRDKISKTRIERRIGKGENNFNWKGGITKVAEKIRKCERYIYWRIQVFERDSYTCQDCGKIGYHLEAHHIKSFSDILETNNIKCFEDALKCTELWDIHNGETLCDDCHNKYPRRKKR